MRFIIAILVLFPVLTMASPLKAVVNQANNFLVISDIHLDTKSTHLMEIMPLKNNKDNDLDTITFDKLLSEINQNIQKNVIDKPQFIIVLGDVVGHIRDSADSARESEAYVFKALKTTFPTTPIFYIFGNNDSLEVNYGPFVNSQSEAVENSPYQVAKIEGQWNNGFLSTGNQCQSKNSTFPCLITENSNDGFYSAYLKSGFRLISLNTVMFSPGRKDISDKAISDQLDWLQAQLTVAEKNNESVMIAMHIPPGNNVYDHSAFWTVDEQNRFLTLIQKYQKNVIGILAAHTHAEELKVIQDAMKNTITGVYFTAALSTSHANSPSVKTFYFSKENTKWHLLNYATFHVTEDHSELVLDKLYNYHDYYCTQNDADLSACLNNITAEKMLKYFSAGNPNFTGTMQSPNDIILTLPNQK